MGPTPVERSRPRKEAWPFYRTISGVRLCWELEEPKGSRALDDQEVGGGEGDADEEGGGALRDARREVHVRQPVHHQFEDPGVASKGGLPGYLAQKKQRPPRTLQ